MGASQGPGTLHAQLHIGVSNFHPPKAVSQAAQRFRVDLILAPEVVNYLDMGMGAALAPHVVGQLQVLDHGAVLVGAPGHPQVHLYESHLTRLPGRKHPCIYKKGPRCRLQSPPMNSTHSLFTSHMPGSLSNSGDPRAPDP